MCKKLIFRGVSKPPKTNIDTKNYGLEDVSPSKHGVISGGLCQNARRNGPQPCTAKQHQNWVFDLHHTASENMPLKIEGFHWKKGGSYWKPHPFFWGKGRVYAPIQRKQIPKHEPPDPYPLMKWLPSMYGKHPSASPF